MIITDMVAASITCLRFTPIELNVSMFVSTLRLDEAEPHNLVSSLILLFIFSTEALAKLFAVEPTYSSFSKI